MKRKYETRCWLCGSTQLVPDARGMKCGSCGATYNIIPKPGHDTITLKPDITGVNEVGGATKSPSPAGILQRQVAKKQAVFQEQNSAPVRTDSM